MRNRFAQELEAIAAADERVVMLSGDIGNRLFDRFKQRFPNRFYNCGVAEANMIGVASGLAMSGLRPIAYTITPFITTRCLEQIRVDVCYHNVPVIIVGVGAGLAYAELGGTHHACEDVGFLRLLPEMSVICPGDPIEVQLALRAAIQQAGPVYIRLGKKGEPEIHASQPEFEIGRGIQVQDGSDVAILSNGIMLPVAKQVADQLAADSISVRLISMHTVKPLDESLLSDVFSHCSLVATVEEHSVLGGLGGAVAEWRCDHPQLRGQLVRIGTPDQFFHEAGDQAYARQQFGIDAGSIAQRLKSQLQQRSQRV